MSYHRGGHPGAVAVSFSTNTMAPLSPSRRYSGTNGGTAGSTSSTTGGGSTSKYSYRSSGGDRPGSYHSSASATGYRASSFTSSTDSYRRPYISPVRSVSSYNETSSIVGSSTITGSLRYGSASSSSASSTASSTSSCASRERNGQLQHTTPSSLSTSTADFYAKYSPTYYVPNIHGGSSSIGNGHWRPSSSSSSSGISSGTLAELHGTDDYDSCRDRRERSYSSETSSGIGLFSSNSSSNSNNHGSAGATDRWSARREAKRRTTPSLGNGGTALTGHAHHDGGPAETEVTVNADDRNNVPGSDSSSSSGGGNRRPAATTPAESSAASSSSSSAANPAAASTLDETTNDRNRPTDRDPDYDDQRPDNRDLDNNNAHNNNNNNNNINNSYYNDGDSLLERDNNDLDQRRRRRRGNVEQQLNNGDPNDDDDNNETVVARNNRDFNGESNFSEIDVIIGIGSTSGDSRAVNHHHGRPTASSNQSRGVVSVSATSVAPLDPNIPSDDGSATSALTPTSSASRLTSVPSTCDVVDSHSAPAANVSRAESRGVSITDVATKKISLNAIDESSIATRGGDGGGGCGAGVAGGDADHHRTAYTWTKIPTNPDNTELLTNNNGQDREADVLGITDPERIVDGKPATGKTKIREKSAMGISETRKSLLWTATNEFDGDFESGNEKIENNNADDVENSSSLEPAIPVATNDDDDDEASGFGETSNGGRNEKNNDEDDSDPAVYDFDGEDTSGISLRINGVAGRPSGSRGDDPGKPSTSRRTLFGWNEPTIDDVTGASSSTAASSSAGNSVPVAVHQNLYRGANEQIDESSNSRPPRSRLQSRRDERYGLNGLRNIGNTCFMNSVIQCLSNTRPLLEYLLNEQHLHDINTTTSSMKGALIKAFGQVIHELWEMSGDHVVNTTALKSQIQRFAPRFMGYSQQDAQEFLRYLLEGLHEDVNRVTVKPQPILTDIPDHYSDSHKAAESWKRYLRSEDSTIVDVFVGQLRSSLHCTSCDHVSVTLDPVWDLSLPIPARSGTVKLNQCLEHFTKVETMDGDEKPTCSKCQMRRKCTKSFSIQKFPKILVIHLKRFSPTERFRGKLSVLVDFPLTGLDLSAFAAPGVQGCTYNLYGVANHSGTTYSGHYTAYCKHPYSGEWHEYNDNRVSSVPARSVVSSEAYVLFYEQQSPSPHL